MAKTILERAKKAFYGKRYNDVITLLEPNVIQYRDSFQFYYFLGLACLYTGDVGGATSYFQRARQIKMRDPDLLTAQAALFLRRGETHQAVEYYLEALEYAPQHRLAKRSLDFIRKKGDEETIRELSETGKMAKFYPMPRKKNSLQQIVFIFAAIILLAGGIGFGFRSVSSLQTTSVRADLSSIVLDSNDRSSLVQKDGAFKYILTERQILDTFASAQRNFQSYHDNAAQVEINRLLWSNASASIKQKARILMGYLAEPGFDTIKDKYDYADIIKDPDLYLDCWIVWKGMATNIVTTDNTLDFDFLVGYDTRNKLEGIVPVHFDKVIEVNTDKPLELLGKIANSGGKLELRGNGIFQSGKPLSQ
jgi:tetratricopeptide (TPR) repeat protein